MRLNPQNTSPSLVGKLIITSSTDPVARGLDYLYGVRCLALDSEMIDVVYDMNNRIPLCAWISEHIDGVNRQLEKYLQACHDCFHPWEQPPIQICAAPIAQGFGIDALCNLQTHPITILIDVGRVVPADWLRLVVHEYAHAHVGFPGHQEQFARSLSHLCLGLGIAPPPRESAIESHLRFYPDCRPTQNPLAFWRGE
ncbi:hypothetical protein [Nostoc sp. UHCC 0870]|uniref:hypothetical protein n=1 Tax=Nostoc sp. UHCC 0870 TaxID=2914041 RepID=UPI001EE01EEC|nr:hypothetical protein [Nostoc sp. UHCC 0870]UKP00336.1 hypothetical protein L6494_11820 [Nostoc sp. UHCC 0870]